MDNNLIPLAPGTEINPESVRKVKYSVDAKGHASIVFMYFSGGKLVIGGKRARQAYKAWNKFTNSIRVQVPNDILTKLQPSVSI